MTVETTARLGLPLLQPGQAQKEMSHNEALAGIDLVVQAAVEHIGATEPPADPVPGQCWVVGDGASGSWAGADGSIAGWTGGGWRFVAARAGMTVWSAENDVFGVFDGTQWRSGDLNGQRLRIAGLQVVGEQRPAIADPGGGSVIDAEGRATLVAVLEALRAHGLIASG